MAIPILNMWKKYFDESRDEGLGSTYERFILNRLLGNVIRDFRVATLLEVPSFGFTGLSGINSMQAARDGVRTTVCDNTPDRLARIEKIWRDVPVTGNFQLLENFHDLPFSDNAFDLTWNFSALWFAGDLGPFLTQIARVTRKAVLLCVPNRSGLGYLSQKHVTGRNMHHALIEKNIIPDFFIPEMEKLNWKLVDHGFIDCPPWPDIGMSKEEFVGYFGIRWPKKNCRSKNPLTILDYYTGRRPELQREMLEYDFLETRLPDFCKRLWAHHRYFLFTR